MKKFLNKILLLSTFLFLMNLTVLANTNEYNVVQQLDIDISINDDIENFNNPVVIFNNKTYVSLRELSEKLGFNVEWNNENKSIEINSAYDVSNTENKPSDVLYPYEADNGYWGYKDSNGNIVVKPIYDIAMEFNDEMALVHSDANFNDEWGYGYIDKTGKEVISCKYLKASEFSEGLAAVYTAQGTDQSLSWVYIDKQENQVFDKAFEMACDFHNNYALVLKEGYGFSYISAPERKWSYINRDGEYATDLTFDTAGFFSSGYAMVKQTDKWGIINTNFEYVLPCEYDDIEEVSAGIFYITVDNETKTINLNNANSNN